MLEAFMSRVKYLVCDLDGTLCDVQWRQHLAKAGAWDEFHEGIPNDEVRETVYGLLLGYLEAKENNYWSGANSLIFLTGRPEAHRASTQAWLQDNCCFYEHDDYDALLMRADGQYGSDVVVKQALLEEYLELLETGEPVEELKKKVLILDDRDKVVEHFRDLGYEVWQVNQGAF